MQRDDVLSRLDKAKNGEADLAEVMEVLAEFYLSFSKHIKEIKEMITKLHNIAEQQQQQLAEFHERLKIIELTCVNPYDSVRLGSGTEEESEE